MRELNVNEMKEVSGGFPPLLILAAEGVAIAGGFAAGKALGRYIRSFF